MKIFRFTIAVFGLLCSPAYRGEDRYGRTVGIVTVGGININQSLLSADYAWQYRKYCKASFCKDWLPVEKHTQDSKVGLWRDSVPVSPWQWCKRLSSSQGVR